MAETQRDTAALTITSSASAVASEGTNIIEPEKYESLLGFTHVMDEGYDSPRI